MLKLLIFPLAAAAALAVGGGVYWLHARQVAENEAETRGIMADAMLYNVRQFVSGGEPVEVHARQNGMLAACGLTFTAISQPDNSAIAIVFPGRQADCARRDDVIARSP